MTMTRYKAATIATYILLALLATLSVLLVLQSRRKIQTPTHQNPNSTVHYSTLMGKEFFNLAYKQAPTIIKTDSPIAGGTVNHHLLAAPLDAQFFEGLAKQKPKRIILIGPDHMSRGSAPITTTLGIWRTPYGDLQTDTELITNLTRWHLVNIEESPFDYEFSVGGLVPFVKRSLPDAMITTIIVKVNTTNTDLDALAAALPTDNDTVVIGSIDFSHYLPSRAAEFHDITNRAILNAFDYDNFNRLEIDSPTTLRVLLKYLERRDAKKATLVASTDSAKITGKLDTQETTSYLNQYFSKGESAPLDIKTSLYIPSRKKIISMENRFMGGYLHPNDGVSLPKNLKYQNMAVGIVENNTTTTYYLFPFIKDKIDYRLMTTSEEGLYFKQHNIDNAIIHKVK